MRRHCVCIKEIYGQQYTAELLRQSDNENILRNFLRAQNIIIVQCEEYHDQPQAFGNTYADVREDNKTRSLVWARNTIKEWCDFLHFLGLHVVGINSYTQVITNEQAVAIITKSADDTNKLFASLDKKSSKTQENLAQSFRNEDQWLIQHIIDKVLAYIREAVILQKKDNNTNAKNLLEELISLEDELVRNRRSTNTEKNKQTIQQALRILDQIELVHIQNNPNDPILADSSIGSRDLELAYSSYTRRDIRHPDQQPHLSNTDKTMILGKFLRKDILSYGKNITPQHIMQTINQAIYMALLIYIVYGISLIILGTPYIQSRTYNLVNIGVLGISRYTIYKIYQKYTKNIYLAIGAVIILWQILSRLIYSYIAL